jgi:hypothetical protein
VRQSAWCLTYLGSHARQVEIDIQFEHDYLQTEQIVLFWKYFVGQVLTHAF